MVGSAEPGRIPGRHWPALLLLLCVLALAAFPAVANRFYLQHIPTIMIMAIFAMSLDLLVGFTGQVSFGHAAFFGIGAYALFLASPAELAPSLWLSLALALAAAAAAAFVIGLLVLRSAGVYFIMATLAFSQMLFYYAARAKWLGGSDGAYIYLKPDTGLAFFDLADKRHFYYLVLALMVAVYAFLRVLLRSPFGHALRGIKDNEPRMRSLGFATFRLKLLSFVIAGTLAGLAGYLDAAQFGVVNPDLLGWRLSGTVLMMVILGGMGTLYGPVLGAFALVLLQDFLSDQTKHWLLPMGLFIILAVLVLPDGLGGLIAWASRARRSAVPRG
ncbi:MAG TPA: branched-chain amino acid ABC transporter permease [Stellaceae bacterium]|nr:branched-chain amino acid ABC transporter permease [Stellaceae bacterium]